MDNALYVVAIVVDPEFGDRVDDLLGRMPVWMGYRDGVGVPRSRRMAVKWLRLSAEAGDADAINDPRILPARGPWRTPG